MISASGRKLLLKPEQLLYQGRGLRAVDWSRPQLLKLFDVINTAHMLENNTQKDID
jgi:hypothetical protein